MDCFKNQQNSYDSSGSDSGTNEPPKNQSREYHHWNRQITSKFNLLHQNLFIRQNYLNPFSFQSPIFCEKCRLPISDSTICEIRQNRVKSNSISSQNSIQYFHPGCLTCSECQSVLFNEIKCFKRGNQVSRLVCARCFLGHCYKLKAIKSFKTPSFCFSSNFQFVDMLANRHLDVPS